MVIVGLLWVGTGCLSRATLHAHSRTASTCTMCRASRAALSTHALALVWTKRTRLAHSIPVLPSSRLCVISSLASTASPSVICSNLLPISSSPATFASLSHAFTLSNILFTILFLAISILASSLHRLKAIPCPSKCRHCALTLSISCYLPFRLPSDCQLCHATATLYFVTLLTLTASAAPSRQLLQDRLLLTCAGPGHKSSYARILLSFTTQ